MQGADSVCAPDRVRVRVQRISDPTVFPSTPTGSGRRACRRGAHKRTTPLALRHCIGETRNRNDKISQTV